MRKTVWRGLAAAALGIGATVASLAAATAASAAPAPDAPSVFGSIAKMTEPASFNTFDYIRLDLNKSYGRPVAVKVYDCQRPDDTATLGVDLQPTQQWVTFAPGTTSQQVAVTINSDNVREKDEFTSYCLYSTDVTIRNSWSNGAHFGLTIGDKDSPRLAQNVQYVMEGTPPSGIASQYLPVKYTVRLNNPAATDSTVGYSVVPMVATDRFKSYQSTLTFLTGEQSKDITIQVKADHVPNGNAEAWIAFDNPVGFNGSYVPDWHGDQTSWGKLVITDDDH